MPSLPSDAVSEFSKSMGNSQATQSQIVVDSVLPSDELTRFLFNVYKLRVRSTRVKLESQPINTAFILGHSSNGKLNGSSTLGTSGLGTRVTELEEFDIEPMVKTGLYELAKFLANKTDVQPAWLGYGSGSTAMTQDDTALGTEIDRVLLI